MTNLDKSIPIEFTDSALKRIALLLKSNRAEHETLFGIRIGITKKGCGGNSYKMEFCTHKEDYDDLFTVVYDEETINILIDKKAMFYLFGTKIDYVQRKLESGFEFYNSKEAGRCGCGESFYTT